MLDCRAGDNIVAGVVVSCALVVAVGGSVHGVLKGEEVGGDMIPKEVHSEPDANLIVGRQPSD